MTAQSISAVVQQAVEWTGMEHVPVQDRTRHHGSGYLARAFEDYLRMLAVRHICCYYSPHHPQSNGKLERFHETLNARVNLVVYTGPDQLRAALAEFIVFYNHQRYHEGIGNMTPADVYLRQKKRNPETERGFLRAVRGHGSSFRLRAARAYEIEAGGPVCKGTSSARRKHLRGSCSPPFSPDHGPVTQGRLRPSLTSHRPLLLPIRERFGRAFESYSSAFRKARITSKWLAIRPKLPPTPFLDRLRLAKDSPCDRPILGL